MKKKLKKIPNKKKVNINILKKIINKNPLLFKIGLISLVFLILFTFVFDFIISLILIAVFDAIIYTLIKRNKNKKGKKKYSTLKIIFIACFMLGIFMLLSVIGFFIYIAKTAPTFDPDKLYQSEATIVYDSTGEIIAKLGVEKREKLTYDELPQVLIDAIIATEDSRFFQHNGFDLPRFIKASLGQVTGASSAGGASTLTMQLSKNIYTSTNDKGIQGIIRKFTDIYMAIFQIEKHYTKQEILEFYVNYNYLGGASRGGAYGVEQASLIYFGKSAKDLNLAEASMIAGLFQSPNKLDPLKNPEAATKRRSTVLYLMELHGYITHEEREFAEATNITDLLSKDYIAESYQGFIDTVVEEIKTKTGFDPYTVPMEIYTTMDRNKQKYLDDIMSGETFTWSNEKVQAGVVALDTKTGAVLAVGANRNTEGEKNYNYATMIKNQIGSTAKPLYDYGPAIEYNNLSTYNLFADEPYTYSNGQVINNWDGQFTGLITMRTALSYSRNIPALKTFKSLDNAKVKEFVTNLGLSPEVDGGKLHEAHSIGGYNGESPLTLAAAYAAFGNEGIYNEPHSFTKLIYRETGEEYINKYITRTVMGTDTAYMITSMLTTTAPLALGRYSTVNNATIAAKTGTTNYAREVLSLYPNIAYDAVNDVWVAAYDPVYTVAVWVGYDKISQEYVNNGYYNTIRSFTHAILFNKVGKGIFDDNKTFSQPSSVKSITVEKDSNPAKLPSKYTPSDMVITELFKEGAEPTEVSDRYDTLKDVTELKSSISGNKITLTWKAIDTPNAINNDSLKKYFETLYSDTNSRNIAMNNRISYNTSYIGTIIYNIYSKDEKGNLTFIASTDKSTIDIKITSTLKPITYVVKTSYTIFKSNISGGVTLTVDLTGVDDLIIAELNGDEVINLSIGDTYTLPTKGVIVSEGATDVTNSATITRTINNSKNQTVTSIDTEEKETYTITYSVTYKTYTDNLVQTIIVE